MEAGDYQVTNELTHLGRMLFYDPRLSINQQMSCNTCHLLNDYGVDGLTTSLGHESTTPPSTSRSSGMAALKGWRNRRAGRCWPLPKWGCRTRRMSRTS